jgi:uncharacterized cupin superfamily protein
MPPFYEPRLRRNSAQNGPPPHIHLREDESFWVLDGEFSVSLGDRTLMAGAPVAGAITRCPARGASGL